MSTNVLCMTKHSNKIVKWLQIHYIPISWAHKHNSKWWPNNSLNIINGDFSEQYKCSFKHNQQVYWLLLLWMDPFVKVCLKIWRMQLSDDNTWVLFSSNNFKLNMWCFVLQIQWCFACENKMPITRVCNLVTCWNSFVWWCLVLATRSNFIHSILDLWLQIIKVLYQGII
jgi:hypothetical protein